MMVAPDIEPAPQLAAGGNKLLRLFDVATPGRQCYVVKTHSKKHPGQPGELRCPGVSERQPAGALGYIWDSKAV